MNDGADETFLSRWSRRKALQRQETSRPVPDAPPLPEATGPVAPAATAALPADAAVVAPPSEARPAAAPAPPPPTLEEVRALTPSSDFTRFVAPGVDSEVKNAAMKKLFTDPHFNVMDGLDTYIDDYGKSDPIPKSMLRQMVQARVLGLLDDELEEQPLPVGELASGAAASREADHAALEATATSEVDVEPTGPAEEVAALEAATEPAPDVLPLPVRDKDGVVAVPPAA